MDMRTHGSMGEMEINASLYYWWLAFLRCSKDYWWCCQLRGQCQDPRLISVWKDFGDIFQYPCFMHWWQDHGAKLFDSPQMEIGFIKQLGAGLELILRDDLVVPRPGMICIAIPEYLENMAAQTLIWEAWQVARVRGRHYAVDAKYQLYDLPLRSKRTIVRAYQSLTLSVCVENSIATDAVYRWGEFEMGRYLNISPKNNIVNKDSKEKIAQKRNAVRNIFSQSKDGGLTLVANAEIGQFPCKNPVEPRQRWTKAQQDGLDHAVSSGQWQSRHWLEDEYAFMMPNKPILLGGNHEHSTFQIMRHIDSMEVSFLTPKRPRKDKPKKRAR